MNRKLKNEELNRVNIAEFKHLDKTPLIIVLDNIRSLNNIGSIFRTADAFKIEKIILAGITATPPHREIQKTALGATESVEWEYEKDIIIALKRLKEQHIKLISIEQAENSIPLNEFKPEETIKYAIILGNEITGVDQKVIDVSDYVVEIPQFGTKHSLNISVAGGIVIWDLFQKLTQ